MKSIHYLHFTIDVFDQMYQSDKFFSSTLFLQQSRSASVSSIGCLNRAAHVQRSVPLSAMQNVFVLY